MPGGSNTQASLTEFHDRPGTTSHPGTSRGLATSWYWSKHDYDEYECPDCGRKSNDGVAFEVHHIDEDPLNNNPENLVGLCHRCHMLRHKTGFTQRSESVEEWKEKFRGLGSDAAEDSVLAT